MIQNSTDADRLERLDGLMPENATPKLELLGCLGPEIVKRVPTLIVWSVWVV